jgi:hypothetical protein
VVNDPVAFARWHLGEVEWGAVLRSEAIEITGPRTLARALPTWSNSPEKAPDAGKARMTAANCRRTRYARTDDPRRCAPVVLAGMLVIL